MKSFAFTLSLSALCGHGQCNNIYNYIISHADVVDDVHFYSREMCTEKKKILMAKYNRNNNKGIKGTVHDIYI